MLWPDQVDHFWCQRSRRRVHVPDCLFFVQGILSSSPIQPYFSLSSIRLLYTSILLIWLLPARLSWWPTAHFFIIAGSSLLSALISMFLANFWLMSDFSINFELLWLFIPWSLRQPKSCLEYSWSQSNSLTYRSTFDFYIPFYSLLVRNPVYSLPVRNPVYSLRVQNYVYSFPVRNSVYFLPVRNYAHSIQVQNYSIPQTLQ